jgi:hypothetical protein
MYLVVFAEEIPDLFRIFGGERFIFVNASAFETVVEIQ